MRIDQYAMRARYAPALVTSIIPIIVFNHFFASEEFSKFVGELMGAKLLSNFTVSALSLYYLSEFGRTIGKGLFENRLFKDELCMPTTNFLMHSDQTYSTEYKQKFGEIVQSEFDITLPSSDDEKVNERAARTRIVEVMALVRKRLEDNEFLLQHNIEYGAMRNAIGGALIGAVLSSLNIWFFSTVSPNELAITLSAITLTLYVALLTLSKPIVNFYGRNYAKVLFREFMGSN